MSRWWIVLRLSLNRLTKADYGSGTSSDTITNYDKYEVDVSYDANGNVIYPKNSNAEKCKNL